MNIKTEFTEPECAYFREQCNFSAEELAVFDLRVRTFSLVEIASRLNILNEEYVRVHCGPAYPQHQAENP